MNQNIRFWMCEWPAARNPFALLESEFVCEFVILDEATVHIPDVYGSHSGDSGRS